MKTCFECGSDKNIVEHHIVPRSRGGTITIPLCQICHDKSHHYDSPRDISVSSLIRDGLERARKRGVQLGRPKTLDKRTGAVMFLRGNGLSYREICGQLHMPLSSVAKIVKLNSI